MKRTRCSLRVNDMQQMKMYNVIYIGKLYNGKVIQLFKTLTYRMERGTSQKLKLHQQRIQVKNVIVQPKLVE